MASVEKYFVWELYSTSRDAYGEEVPSYTNNGNLWGYLEQIKGTESRVQGSFNTSLEAIIRINNLPSVKHKDRLLDGSDVWEITGIVQEWNELLIEAVKIKE